MQSGILDMAYSVYFIAYTVSLAVYILHGNLYKLNMMNSSLIF